MKLSQAIFAISIFTTQSAFAQIAECDLLASSPLDPQKQSAGVSYRKLDHVAAVPACKIAITENKQAPRLWFQYGRALEKENKLPDAIIAYQEAAKLGSGAAHNNMGELYRDGKGFEVNLKMAEDFFKKASDLNSIEGKDNLLKLQGKNKPSIPNQATPALAAANNEKSASNVSTDNNSWNFLKGICIYNSRAFNAGGKSLDVAINDCSNQVVNSRPQNQEINYHIYGEDLVDSVLAPFKSSGADVIKYKTKIKYEKSSNKNALLTTEGSTDCADVFEYVLVDNKLTRRLIKQIMAGCSDFVKSTAKDRFNAQSVPFQLMFIQGTNKPSISSQSNIAIADANIEKLKKDQADNSARNNPKENIRSTDKNIVSASSELKVGMQCVTKNKFDSKSGGFSLYVTNNSGFYVWSSGETLPLAKINFTDKYLEFDVPVGTEGIYATNFREFSINRNTLEAESSFKVQFSSGNPLVTSERYSCNIIDKEQAYARFLEVKRQHEEYIKNRDAKTKSDRESQLQNRKF